MNNSKDSLLTIDQVTKIFPFTKKEILEASSRNELLFIRTDEQYFLVYSEVENFFRSRNIYRREEITK